MKLSPEDAKALAVGRAVLEILDEGPQGIEIQATTDEKYTVRVDLEYTGVTDNFVESEPAEILEALHKAQFYLESWIIEYRE